ncbi:hypothetical protein [Bradyrhizobium sp.]|uniref:hypothetical protein n=1 Tax=Bradyrhizobium sp. TaxID=376 RepID=UPI002D4F6DB8|nr:hypothetical protein [Bradyrhizobium sp.]HZR73066.1 hypothetical protein [Bradyrhizobium sp.]
MLATPPDPLHRTGAVDPSYPLPGRGFMPPRAPRGIRFITALQMLGSLLGIPVGLASGYSIYRANFSAETACQTLRANIVAVIDKKLDATTRRMLVRHDVEEFEKSCGTLDPDAKAAFQRLLTAEDSSVARPAAVAARAPAPEAFPKPKVPPPKKTAAAAPDTGSDAKWLDDVRRALQAHSADRPAADEPPEAANPASLSPPPNAGVAAMETPPPTGATPIAGTASAGAAFPAQLPAAEHPIPPAPIPLAASASNQNQAQPRIGDLVAQIPWLGPVLSPESAQPR